MSPGHIQISEAVDRIVTLTIARPEKLNALSAQTLDELDAAFESFEKNSAIGAVIITGAGPKSFVAGADIEQLAKASPLAAREIAHHGQRVFRRIETCGKPVIAAINGFALGGGLELAMACTLRVASSSAKLGQPEVKLGIIPGFGGTQRLPMLVGRGRAMEMLLTGDPISADEAYRIGLVNHVVAPDQLLATAHEIAAKMLANAPAALSLTMEAVDVGLACGLDQGLQFEATAFAVSAATEDKREGTQAFLEKRKPNFSGK